MKFTLEQARKYRNLSQKQIAIKLGISLQTYNEYEKYRKIFRMDMANLFSQIVDLPMDQIVYLDEKKAISK